VVGGGTGAGVGGGAGTLVGCGGAGAGGANRTPAVVRCRDGARLMVLEPRLAAAVAAGVARVVVARGRVVVDVALRALARPVEEV
jgi:hypothetical protein